MRSIKQMQAPHAVRSAPAACAPACRLVRHPVPITHSPLPEHLCAVNLRRLVSRAAGEHDSALSPAEQSSSAVPAPPTNRTPSSNAGSIPGRDSSSSSSSSNEPSTTGTTPLPSYDPSLAKGFFVPDGQEQLWWVEKFEERRKAEALAAAAAATKAVAVDDGGADTTADAVGSSNASGSSSSTRHAGVPPPAGSTVAAAPAPQPTLRTLLSISAQVLQLCIATAALILWPASLIAGGLQTPRIWLLWATYVVFFCCGTVARILRHGPLSPRSKDAQTRTWYGTAALVLFIAVMPLVHWSCVSRYCRLQQLAPEWAAALTACDLLAGVLLPAALVLHWSATRHLGKAYDRVVTPDTLVTTGPYGWVQHPIYTSYMLLFAGFCLTLRNVGAALVITAVCLLYYSLRCSLEQQTLQKAFGEPYARYVAATGRFVPRAQQVLRRALQGSQGEGQG